MSNTLIACKCRFELAIAGYKDVSDQLRRWQAVFSSDGASKADVRRAIGERLGPLDLFALHSAFFALEREASAETCAAFEREVERFESAMHALRTELVSDGIPVL